MGSFSSGTEEFGPCALVIVGTNGEITSRKAIKKLALRCQCLRLWIFILIGLNTQNLADGEFVLHPKTTCFEQTLS
jgi:hypothetical protein